MRKYAVQLFYVRVLSSNIWAKYVEVTCFAVLDNRTDGYTSAQGECDGSRVSIFLFAAEVFRDDINQDYNSASTNCEVSEEVSVSAFSVLSDDDVVMCKSVFDIRIAEKHRSRIFLVFGHINN